MGTHFEPVKKGEDRADFLLVAIYVAQHRRILSSGVRFVQIPCHVNFLKMTIDESRSLDLQPVVPILYLTVSYLMCTTFLSFLCSTPISRLSKKWKCGCVADSRSATLPLPQSSQVWQTAVRTQKPPKKCTGQFAHDAGFLRSVLRSLGAMVLNEAAFLLEDNGS